MQVQVSGALTFSTHGDLLISYGPRLVALLALLVVVRQLLLAHKLARLEPLEDGGFTHPWIPYKYNFVLWQIRLQCLEQVHFCGD